MTVSTSRGKPWAIGRLALLKILASFTGKEVLESPVRLETGDCKVNMRVEGYISASTPPHRTNHRAIIMDKPAQQGQPLAHAWARRPLPAYWATAR